MHTAATATTPDEDSQQQQQQQQQQQCLRKDVTDTATLFEVLQSGVVLCKVANKLMPGCISSFTSDFR